jgi:EAL domain-containing protein (putative c-di-GMP-specific phosphodiesterase class I)
MAIEQNQLVPFFQPKVAVKTGEVVGVETLARWKHPERGIVPPNLFIPVAEKHGLIDLLTQDMLLKTLQQAAIWHKNGIPITFAINFSALSLSDINLPDRLEAELRKTGIAPSYLTLEVTESRLLEHITSSLETLLRLRLKGIHLSVDDFGTGHSSLEELHRIPFSELKVDRVFVSGAAHDDEARLFLQSAVALAKKLNLSIVAEGVETQDDWDICAKLECDVIQGFFIAHPMPAETFLEWYNSRKNPVGKIKTERPFQ